MCEVTDHRSHESNGRHGSSLVVDVGNWQSRLTQAVDKQPCKIKQINIIYGENTSI